MRYTGGLLGGSWLTALTSDLGNGKFDGAWLVQNFENLNPSNTLWTKQYNLYSKVDTRGDRAISEFERWWGGHVNLNAEEIQFIVDELFVGNKLAAGEIQTSDGTAIDLRNIRSPIVVFCSEGRQHHPAAAGARLDPRPLRQRRRHPRPRPDDRLFGPREGRPPRHLRVGRGRPQGAQRVLQQHRPDRRAAARPLRGDLRTQERRHGRTPTSAAGDWVMRCEQRTLDDIRALGGNDPADDRCFAAAARVSEINLALYRTFAQPFVRALANPTMAEWMQKLHPLRHHLRAVLGCKPDDGDAQADDRLGARASQRRRRRTIRSSRGRRMYRKQIIAALDAWRDARDRARGTDILCGLRFARAAGGGRHRSREHATFAQGRPRTRCTRRLLQHADRRTESAHSGRRPARSDHPRAAVCRHGRASAVDERGFEIVRRIRRESARVADPAAAGIQGAGARAILHAADRPRGAR